jgi:hypothetical protein
MVYEHEQLGLGLLMGKEQQLFWIWCLYPGVLASPWANAEPATTLPIPAIRCPQGITQNPIP